MRVTTIPIPDIAHSRSMRVDCDVVIDEEFRGLIPPLTEAELAIALKPLQAAKSKQRQGTRTDLQLNIPDRRPESQAAAETRDRVRDDRGPVGGAAVPLSRPRHAHRLE